MFERIRHHWNYGNGKSFGLAATEALESGDYKAAAKYAERSIIHIKRAITLGEKIKDPIPASDLQGMIDTLEKVKDLSQKVELAGSMQEISSVFGVATSNPANYWANRMVDAYRIAADRLDDSLECLRLIYAQNPAAPPGLREIMTQYIEGKLSKDEARKRLSEAQESARQHFKEAGLNPDEESGPAFLYEKFLKGDGEEEKKKDS